MATSFIGNDIESRKGAGKDVYSLYRSCVSPRVMFKNVEIRRKKRRAV
jgi:hypothetical protein